MINNDQLIHKTFVTNIQFKSHTIHNFWKNEGDRTLNIYERIGSLLMLTTTENELYSKVSAWESELADWFNQEIESIQKQKEAFMENAGLEESPEVMTPSSYESSVPVCYPVTWKLLNLIQTLDNEIAELENLWLTGFVTDLGRHENSNRAIGLLRKLVAKISNATSPGKDRSGGRFKSTQLISLIRGGLELYVDDSLILKQNEEIKAKASIKNTEKKTDSKSTSLDSPTADSKSETEQSSNSKVNAA